ncbi:MAG: tRNA (adenosine(37)-N6)-threonylcarbamoyltransferase complex dimerization subunit type 1 TsaB [bacterium]|nr:tRNA (adenosine(37)-N6)-threonylcarbamoyltransferase complex dimerization subunit type 1 TsaB [bacterium]
MADLAIDTSTSFLSLAIVKEDLILYEKNIYSLKLHSILLPKEIEKALEITKEKIERIFVAIGPGSFTGLRVGLSLVKGIILFSKIQVIGVPTFDGLAYNLPIEGKLFIIMRYRLSKAYYGVYRAEDKKWIQEKLGVAEIEELPTLVTKEKVAIVKEQNYNEIANMFQNPIFITPRAFLLTIPGRERKPSKTEELNPIYIEPSEAEKIKGI